MSKWLVAVLLLCAWTAIAQDSLQYRLRYAAAGDHAVQVEIGLKHPIAAPATLVIPRSYPGGYSLVAYDTFLENIRAYSENGKPVSVKRERFGPRWELGSTGEHVARVEYAVDLARMENGLFDAIETSKVRPRYVGILGYSVFGFIEGQEQSSIALTIEGPSDWPVFTTLQPTVPAPRHMASAAAGNYCALADSEVLMGPDLQLSRSDGPINLVLAVYTETQDEDLALEAELAHKALNSVQRYFGDKPFPTYTVELELLKPLPGHDYGFSQEHLDSGTFSLSTDRAITAGATKDQRDSILMNYAHHMAHSWIPKRAYGEGYMPFLWEMPPVIDTIWFNEGFGRYAGIESLAESMPPVEGAQFRRTQLDRLRQIVDAAPPFIRSMSTSVLSREASFMYSEDFRIGMNTFSRGSLMAAEMDDFIRGQSKGKKSLRDGLNALIVQTQRENRPFKMEEFPIVIKQATGVDVRGIYDRWLRAQEK